jgi:hypothetical protein
LRSGTERGCLSATLLPAAVALARATCAALLTQWFLSVFFFPACSAPLSCPPPRPHLARSLAQFKYGEDLAGNPALWYGLAELPRRERQGRLHTAALRVSKFVRSCARANTGLSKGLGKGMSRLANLAQKDETARALGGAVVKELGGDAGAALSVLLEKKKKKKKKGQKT